MAPCCNRCGNIRLGYCSNIRCRQEEQQEKEREKEAQVVGQKKRIAADCSKRGCKKRGGRKALAPAGPCQAQEVDQRKKIAADCSERSCKKRGGKKALVPAGPCQAQEVDRRKKIAADCSERSCKKRGGKKALAPAGPCQGKAQVVGHTFQKITSMAHHTETKEAKQVEADEEDDQQFTYLEKKHKRGTPDSPTKSPPSKKTSSNQTNARPSQQSNVFFEEQEGARCGKHALNNALGHRYFDTADMQDAAETFIWENPELGDDIERHISPDGDYSIETMMMALRTAAMKKFGRLSWQMRDTRATSIRDLEDCVGAVQNHNNRHWVALRRAGENFLYVDSLNRAKQATILTTEQLEATLRAHPTYAIREI
ncbi:unnamed protein product [Symbiodinium natans]|uniref:ubiquitinyl hydrolase 1 n=1 Tax=Symbiodinium natans TaxID=878477 RepID=A0A812LCZ8_9DINO|nr:unnamed protein product [Symbiodinium natans]